ncbi:MAG: hypothetical protein MUC81_07145 [Bacteroidia bacterium]|jgi:lantibiotic modifying enzyme|nr:hypothetical protein [Bacteroidia bacterium]
MNLNSDILAKVREELNVINKILLSVDVNRQQLGLYNGLSGIALMMATNYLANKESIFRDKLSEILEKTSLIIENDKVDGMFSVGLAGWGWLILHLEEKELLEDIEDVLSQIDYVLFLDLRRLLYQNEYDMLNGAISIGLYFIKRKQPERVSPLINYLEAFCKSGVFDLKRKMHRTGEYVFDFGLAHGYAGVIYFLSKCAQSNYEVEKSISLIKLAKQFMFSNLLNYEIDGALFPHLKWVETDRMEKGRLAWCYGDLGVLYTLLKTASIIEDFGLEKFSINGLTLNSDRRNLLECMIFDAGFCHGTAGAAYLFNKVRLLVPKSENFLFATEYWINSTLKKATDKITLERYQFYNPNSEGKGSFTSSYALLDGITGVGLTYLTILYPDLSDWDECLLLS